MSDNYPNKLFAPRYFMHDFVKITASPLMLFLLPKHFYISEKAKVKQKGGAMMFVNHTSLMDPVYCLCSIIYRRPFFVVAEEVLKSKFLHWFLIQNLCIPINRNNFSLKSYRTIVSLLKQGKMFVIFPEGQVNRGEGLLPFKDGFLKMALHSHVPVVPMYIKKRTHFFERLRIYHGEPVDVNDLLGENYTDEDFKHAVEYLQDKMMELYNMAKEIK